MKYNSHIRIFVFSDFMYIIQNISDIMYGIRCTYPVVRLQLWPDLVQEFQNSFVSTKLEETKAPLFRFIRHGIATAHTNLKKRKSFSQKQALNRKTGHFIIRAICGTSISTFPGLFSRKFVSLQVRTKHNNQNELEFS